MGSALDYPPEVPPGSQCRWGECDRKRYGPRPIAGDPCCDKVISWRPGPDPDGRWLVLERLIGRKRVSHCWPWGGGGAHCRHCRPGTYTPPRKPQDDLRVLNTASLYFSLKQSATVNGLRIRNEDIIAFCGYDLARFFDGSDVGAGKLTIDAFAILSPGQVLISFSNGFTVDADHALPGLTGEVDDSDVLLFSAVHLGEVTRGTFSMYVDGTDVGLTTDDEDIDALDVLPDGRIIVSTVGDATVDEIKGRDEDLLAFSPEQLGDETSGKWSMYFDGDDVGLATESTEDVDAVSVGPDSRIYLSARGSFHVGHTTGGAADIFRFSASALGNTTDGEFDRALVFSSHFWGLESSNISGVHVGPAESGPDWAPPRPNRSHEISAP